MIEYWTFGSEGIGLSSTDTGDHFYLSRAEFADLVRRANSGHLDAFVAGYRSWVSPSRNQQDNDCYLFYPVPRPGLGSSGPCPSTCPPLISDGGDAPAARCELNAGHAGDHRSGQVRWWGFWRYPVKPDRPRDATSDDLYADMPAVEEHPYGGSVEAWRWMLVEASRAYSKIVCRYCRLDWPCPVAQDREKPTEPETETTAARIAAIRARLAAVPPGPWTTEIPASGYPQRVTNAQATVIADCFEGPEHLPAVARFIAEARADVEWLLELLDAYPVLDGSCT